MKKSIIKGVLLIIFLFGINNLSQAQYYTGIGIRGGFASGLTVKHFLDANNANAIEGIISSRYKGYTITGLYEFQKSFRDSRLQIPLDWFIGLGAHAGYYKVGDYRNPQQEFYTENVISIGVDGILGIEYIIMAVPFSIGIDLKPYFDFLNPGPGSFDTALTIRYTF